MDQEWIPFILVIVSFLIGSGVIWKFLKYRIDKKQLELNTVKVISDLRKVLSDNLVLLIEKSELYADIRDGKVQAGIPGNKLNQLDTEIKSLRENIQSTEEQLSTIEHRKPRSIKLQFIRSSPPHSLRIE